MRRVWSIGKHRVEAEVNAMLFLVRLDGDSKPVLGMRRNIWGGWPLRVGDRAVEIRRVPTLDVLRTELWVDGVKVPPAPEAIAWKERHCGACSIPLRESSRAVDGVRCKACFERAAEDLRRSERAKRTWGLVLSGAFVLAIALYGIVAGSAMALECATGATFLIAFKVVQGTMRERKAARRFGAR